MRVHVEDIHAHDEWMWTSDSSLIQTLCWVVFACFSWSSLIHNMNMSSSLLKAALLKVTHQLYSYFSAFDYSMWRCMCKWFMCCASKAYSTSIALLKKNNRMFHRKRSCSCSASQMISSVVSPQDPIHAPECPVISCVCSTRLVPGAPVQRGRCWWTAPAMMSTSQVS